eukprot:scaffold157180_cov35-Attheya_sp.AAC.1
MGARNDIFCPLDHPSFRYQTRDKRVKLKFHACRASAYIGKPGIVTLCVPPNQQKESLYSYRPSVSPFPKG